VWNFAICWHFISMHIYQFCRFILIFPRVPIIFTLLSFEYSLKKWKRSVQAFWKWLYFFVIACLRQLSIIYNYPALRHVMTKSDVIPEKLVHCIFIFWVNTQNLTGWNWWVLVEKINAIWCNIKIDLQKLVDICGEDLPTNLQNFMQKDLTKKKIFQKNFGGYFL